MTTFLIEEEGARLDALLAKRFPEHSRTYFQQLIEQDLVFVNGKAPKKKDLLRIGDTVSLTFQERPLPDVLPEDIPLSILYEDDYLIAINKPRGMVVHPGAGNPSGTLVNALLHYLTLPNTSSVRPGIVHRLDKETSGIMIAAKNRTVACPSCRPI